MWSHLSSSRTTKLPHRDRRSWTFRVEIDGTLRTYLELKYSLFDPRAPASLDRGLPCTTLLPPIHHNTILRDDRDLGSDVVQVLVGVDQKRYYVHKNLLQQHSEYFARAFGPNFAEGEEGIIYLDVSEQIFDIFQKWLYMCLTRVIISAGTHVSSKIQGHSTKKPAPTRTNSHIDDEADDEDDNGSMKDPAEIELELLNSAATVHPLLHHLIDLFIFADAYETKSLRNDVMTAIYSTCEEANVLLDYVAIRTAFSKLPSSSTLCQFVIKSYALEWRGEDDGLLDDDFLPPAFLLSALKLTARVGHDEMALEKLSAQYDTLCHFHEHADDEERQACRNNQRKDFPFIRGLIALCLPAIDQNTT